MPPLAVIPRLLGRTTGETRSCVGMRADPLVSEIDLATNRGRLVVDEFTAVPDASDVYAYGDCAAVPDLAQSGEICGMTARHAQRQGKRVAKNVASSLGIGRAEPYKHHDLGFLVDIGGRAAAASPLNVHSRRGLWCSGMRWPGS